MVRHVDHDGTDAQIGKHALLNSRSASVAGHAMDGQGDVGHPVAAVLVADEDGVAVAVAALARALAFLHERSEC